MNQEDIKTQIQLDIEKTEMELRAKKMMLKQVSKKPMRPFIETSVGRGLNHFLAFISTPCAITNRNARMRLDHPRAYRAEIMIDRAEKYLHTLEKETREVGEKTNKMAAVAALYETMLSEFADLDQYQERILNLRQRLVLQVQRLRMPNNGPAKDVTNNITELLEKLTKGLGKKDTDPHPEGA